MADSSRIFVRGLPPTIKEADFRSHFSRQGSVTDIKCIPHRRIGYVGYADHETAAKAVKYFNKSFIRMSRISVEFARPVEELKQSARGSGGHDERVHEKRKRSPSPQTVSNPKLKEFLDVMAPPSKGKTWANEGTADIAKATDIAAAPLDAETAEQSDDEYQSISKKPKTSETKNAPTALSTDDLPVSLGKVKGTQMSSEEPSGEGVHVETAPQASDKDWLRSRTNRLLDLVDIDELPSLVSMTEADPVEDEMDTGRPLERLEDLPNGVPQDAAQSGDAINHDGLSSSDEPGSSDTRRLFLRNLHYHVNPDDLRAHFNGFGRIEEIHVPLDQRTSQGKGFAYVHFEEAESAQKAAKELDGRPFRGRLLHIIAAYDKRETALDENAISKLPLKTQQQIRRKAEASTANFKWNAMYMNPDAVISSVASRLGVSKSDILDPTSSDAAVKQAHAETNVIQETKAYFAANGVNLDAFKQGQHSDSVILVKNFPFGTTSTEIKSAFEAHGNVTKVLMPPAGTIAIVELDQVTQARAAFRALAYRRFKDSVLFLEKAPRNIFEGVSAKSNAEVGIESRDKGKLSATDLLNEENADEVDASATSTLFVRNLNFATTTSNLRELFLPLNGFMSARVKTKTDPKKPGQVLSMGFGFVEFRTEQDAQSALMALNGQNLDGHDLVIKLSHKALDAAEERRKEDAARKLAGRSTKVIIKNLPFEASKKDVRALFAPYGQLRSVRVPKKFDNSTRGFAFADFVTAKEAENAMDVLQGTHLLGRRLNLDFAAADSLDPEEEIAKMQKKVGAQVDKVELKKLAGTGRTKFTIQTDDDNGLS